MNEDRIFIGSPARGTKAELESVARDVAKQLAGLAPAGVAVQVSGQIVTVTMPGVPKSSDVERVAYEVLASLMPACVTLEMHWEQQTATESASKHLSPPWRTFPIEFVGPVRPIPSSFRESVRRIVGLACDASDEQLLATVQRAWDGRPDLQISRARDVAMGLYRDVSERGQKLESEVGRLRLDLAEGRELSGRLARELEVLRRKAVAR